MNTKWSFSLMSWALTLVITCIVMLPIFTTIKESYPFYIENIIFIILTLTFTRFIFLTKHHWFSHTDWVKVILIFTMIPILLYVVDNLWDFQRFQDEEGLKSLMNDVYAPRQTSLAKYIKAEMTFFWAGAFISGIILPLRMMHSIWRVRHRGKV